MALEVARALQQHFAGLLGCDTGVYRQRKPVVVTSDRRSRPWWDGRVRPLWLLDAGRARVLSVVPPLGRHVKGSLGSLLDGDLDRERIAAFFAKELDHFYREVSIRFQYEHWVDRSRFDHVSQVGARPLGTAECGQLDALGKGWSQQFMDHVGREDVLVIEMDGRAAAVGIVHRHDSVWEVGAAVLEEFRGIGLGREALAHACARTLESGAIAWCSAERDDARMGKILKDLAFERFAESVVASGRE